MIIEMAQDYHDALAVMPSEHPKHRMLELLEEAIRRDVHFIDRHLLKDGICELAFWPDQRHSSELTNTTPSFHE